MDEQRIDDYLIREATDSDLDAILCWLKEENDSGLGFYGNRALICSGQKNGNLKALVHADNDAVLGFLLADDQSLSIMEVKAGYRRLGLGRKLAENGLRRIAAADEFGVLIECEPKTSIQFWEALGFTLVDLPDESQNAFITFPKRCSLPPDSTFASVHVEVSTASCSRPHSLQRFHSRAAWVDKRELALEERIVALTDSCDAMVKIDIDGRHVCDEKVKYSCDFGVQYKSRFIRIDHIVCPDRST